MTQLDYVCVLRREMQCNAIGRIASFIKRKFGECTFHRTFLHTHPALPWRGRCPGPGRRRRSSRSDERSSPRPHSNEHTRFVCHTSNYILRSVFFPGEKVTFHAAGEALKPRQHLPPAHDSAHAKLGTHSSREQRYFQHNK